MFLRSVVLQIGSNMKRQVALNKSNLTRRITETCKLQAWGSFAQLLLYYYQQYHRSYRFTVQYCTPILCVRVLGL